MQRYTALYTRQPYNTESENENELRILLRGCGERQNKRGEKIELLFKWTFQSAPQAVIKHSNAVIKPASSNLKPAVRAAVSSSPKTAGLALGVALEAVDGGRQVLVHDAALRVPHDREGEDGALARATGRWQLGQLMQGGSTW